MRGQDPLKEQRVPGATGLLGDRTQSESNGFPGCAGLCRGRTRTKSNGFPVAGDPLHLKSNECPGGSMTGPALGFLHATMFHVERSDPSFR